MPNLSHLPQGALYQLGTKTPLMVGDGVAINGPYDTIGTVIKCSDHPDKDGEYLSLIRGHGHKVPEGFYTRVSFPK